METFEPTALSDAFDRIVHGLPHEAAFNGVEIVLTTKRKNRDGLALTVMIDKTGGVDLATCERIAARINVALEAFTDPYTLEVESAGVNRPLVKPSDYDRFAGQTVKIVTSLLIDGAKTHRGTLIGMRANAILITTPKGELPIPIEAVKTANIEYDIRADLSRAKREKKDQR
jgi:ribosome maturation factor RimP